VPDKVCSGNVFECNALCGDGYSVKSSDPIQSDKVLILFVSQEGVVFLLRVDVNCLEVLYGDRSIEHLFVVVRAFCNSWEDGYVLRVLRKGFVEWAVCGIATTVFDGHDC